MITLHLVRHGQTGWNASGRYQGQNDVPLNPVGRAQAEALGRRLAAASLDVVVSSDLGRTMQTARRLTSGPIVADARLREPDYGQFQGLTYAEMEALAPEIYHRWQTDRAIPPPEGESVSAVLTRLDSFMTDLRADYPQQRVLAVSHGELIALLLCHLTGQPVANFRQLTPHNSSLTTLSVGPTSARLDTFNDIRHLEQTA